MDPPYVPLWTSSSAGSPTTELRIAVDDHVGRNDDFDASATLARRPDEFGPYLAFGGASFENSYVGVTTPDASLAVAPTGPSYRLNRTTYPGSGVVDRRWHMQAPGVPLFESPIIQPFPLRPFAHATEPSYLPAQSYPSFEAAPGSEFSLLDDRGSEMAAGSEVQHLITYEQSVVSSPPHAFAHSQSTSPSTQFPPATSSDPRASITLVPLLEDAAPGIEDSAKGGPKHVHYDGSYLGAAQRPAVRGIASVQRRGGLAATIHHCPYTTCTATLTRVSNLKDHILIHQDRKLYACPSVDCRKRFNTKSLRKSHVKHMHKTMAKA